GSSHTRRDIAEGFRWTWGNRAVRTLTLAIVTFNVTYGAAWSVLVLYATERLPPRPRRCGAGSVRVLYATERLDLGPIGFGLLTTVGALGGVAGMSAYDWLERHASL